MTITREQVADLQPGDVVEYRRDEWPEGAFVRSPLHASEFDKGLYVLEGQFGVRTPDGRPYERMATLTVVSRAPRPLYVNHPRTEAVDHDVVRDGEGAIRHCDAGGFGGKPTWWSFEVIAGCRWTHTTFPPQPLTLLVDGETGQAVQ